MNIHSILCFLLSFSVLVFSTHKVSVYYGNWKAYARNFSICAIPFDKIDRLYYVFSDPTGGTCKFADEDLDLNKVGPIDGECSSVLQPDSDKVKGNMYQLLVIKQKYPHLKVFFVIGGMVYATSMHEYVMTNDTQKMNQYVQSCVDMYKSYAYAFDGVDIDYEYPCNFNDTNCGDITPAFNEKDLFVKYISSFRERLGENVLISLATSSDYEKITALDLSKLDQIVDIYNIMTYDFTSGSQDDPYTGHHTQPYSNQNDPVQSRRSLSADQASTYFVARGANASKINIGVAFYGRGFLIQNGTSETNPFLPSLGAINFGTWETGMIDFYDIKGNYYSENNFFFDNDAKASYIIKSEEGLFITYDDEKSIEEKVIIVEKNGYDGVFAYELTGDNENFDLLNAMRKNYTEMIKPTSMSEKLSLLGSLIGIWIFLFYLINPFG